MHNVVALIGNLGSDPDIRYTQAGTAVCNMQIAVSEHYRDPDGQPAKRTHWFRCTAFARTAEIAAQYLHKGSRIGINGSLVQRTWVDQNTGQNRSSVEIRVNQLELLNGAGRERDSDSESEQNHGGGIPPQPPRYAKPANVPPTAHNNQGIPGDEMLPPQPPHDPNVPYDPTDDIPF
jgi:single-strand DNA-binding protein